MIQGTLQRISTRSRGKPEKPETVSRLFFGREPLWLEKKTRSDWFSNYSVETVKDMGKELMDSLVDLEEMNEFQSRSDPFLPTVLPKI